MSEAADNLGVPNSTLQRWLKQANIDDRKSKTGELTSAKRIRLYSWSTYYSQPDETIEYF